MGKVWIRPVVCRPCHISHAWQDHQGSPPSFPTLANNIAITHPGIQTVLSTCALAKSQHYCSILPMVLALMPWNAACCGDKQRHKSMCNPLVFSNQMTSDGANVSHDMQNRDAKASLARPIGHSVILSFYVPLLCRCWCKMAMRLWRERRWWCWRQ
jgi:hypothetical protein